MTIREAQPDDIPAVLDLIVASADEQQARDSVCVDAGILRRELFGSAPRAFALVADADGALVGLALYFFTFSTWTSVTGIHLEDLYVVPEWRRHKVAAALMHALEEVARARDCRHVRWFVLRENASAVRFYESIGAHAADEWRLMYVDATPA
jgi:GNAT superfamily N-acetyltransferase